MWDVFGPLVKMSLGGLIVFGLIGALLGSCDKATSPQQPAYYNGPVTICNDGWVSHSTGSGTCSWHDGVREYRR